MVLAGATSPHREPARRTRTNGVPPRSSPARRTSWSTSTISATRRPCRKRRSSAGSTLGVLVEVEPGCIAAGADSPEEALALARRVEELPGLRMEASRLRGPLLYGDGPRAAPRASRRRPMDYLVEVADLLRGERGRRAGDPLGRRHGDGVLDGQDPRITELQLGSYAAMDDYHYLHGAAVPEGDVGGRDGHQPAQGPGRPEPRQEDVRCRRRRQPPGLPADRRHEELTPYRFDEEHATYEADDRAR